jgi:hypothetical protein
MQLTDSKSGPGFISRSTFKDEFLRILNIIFQLNIHPDLPIFLSTFIFPIEILCTDFVRSTNNLPHSCFPITK